jgi:hypothetical protein
MQIPLEFIGKKMGEIVTEYQKAPMDSPPTALIRFLALHDAIKAGCYDVTPIDIDAKIVKINAQPDTPLDWCEHCRVWMFAHGAGYECPSCGAYYD